MFLLARLDYLESVELIQSAQWWGTWGRRGWEGDLSGLQTLGVRLTI